MMAYLKHSQPSMSWIKVSAPSLGLAYLGKSDCIECHSDMPLPLLPLKAGLFLTLTTLLINGIKLEISFKIAAQNKKLAHFSKLTEKDEPTLSGLLALARATLLQWLGDAELDKKQVSLLLLPMFLVMHNGHVVA